MKWIKVKDKLPRRVEDSKQYSDDVLTRRVWDDGYEAFYVTYYDYLVEKWHGDKFWDGTITHWAYIEGPENGTKEKGL